MYQIRTSMATYTRAASVPPLFYSVWSILPTVYSSQICSTGVTLPVHSVQLLDMSYRCLLQSTVLQFSGMFYSCVFSCLQCYSPQVCYTGPSSCLQCTVLRYVLQVSPVHSSQICSTGVSFCLQFSDMFYRCLLLSTVLRYVLQVSPPVHSGRGGDRGAGRGVPGVRLTSPTHLLGGGAPQATWTHHLAPQP